MSSQPQMSPQIPPAAQVLNIASGYWLSRALDAAVHLRIADLLHDGPKSSEELAAAAKAHPDALYRALRALASIGIFEETAPRVFAQTPLSETLRDTPGSARAMTVFLGNSTHWKIFEHMLYSVQTGQPAFDRVFGMRPFDYLTQHPDDAREFDEAMTSHSAMANAAIVEAYDFSSFRTIMDIGGGNGGLLAAILGRYPQPRGILFDLPHVIAHAREKGLLPEGRAEMAGGSFFEHVPGGADAYMFKHIIHDWDPASCHRILQTCRRAMSPGSKLLLLEMVVPPGNQPSFAKILDLEMLVFPGGQERTEEEYRSLLAGAGFCLHRIVPTHSPVSIIEADPV